MSPPEPQTPVEAVPPTGPAGPPGARARYFAAAATWADDTLDALRASRRRAWQVAAGLGVVAALQAAALVFLLPLKETVPYTITVERETGHVSAARGVRLGPMAESEAIAQSFAVQYVLARETFDAADYQENYRRVLMWSQGRAEGDYLRFWDRNNPDGAHARYRPTTIERVTVKGVTILGPGSAIVRFDVERSEGGGGWRQPYSATIAYSFSGKPVAAADRFLNPLGYQVTSYRRDAETAAPVNAPPVYTPPAYVPPPAATVPPAAENPAASGTATPSAAQPAAGAAPVPATSPQGGAP